MNHTIYRLDNLNYFFSNFVYYSIDLFDNNFLDYFFNNNFNSLYLSLLLFNNHWNLDPLRNIQNLGDNRLNRDDLIDVNWNFH